MKLKSDKPIDPLLKTKDDSPSVTMWLSRMDFSLEQESFFSRHQEGSGQWLLTSPEFNTWLKEKSSILFCHGISGAGKTILTSIVIDHLLRLFKRKTLVAIAYAYCDTDKAEEQTAERLLRNILKQLLQRYPIVPSSVQDTFKDFEGQTSQPTLKDIAEALSLMINTEHLEVFIIVDALDECSRYHRDRFLMELFHLRDACAIRLMATAQLFPEIKTMFEGVSRVKTVQISPPKEVIMCYIEGEAKKVLEPQITNDREFMDDIKTTIAEIADGMFLLAQLCLASLVGLRPRDLEAGLQSLKTLDTMTTRTEVGRKFILNEAYKKVVRRIRRQEPERVELAKTILLWIVYAQRPLTTKELQHAIFVREGDSAINMKFLDNPSTIAFVCGGLVIVEESTNSIRLMHATTRNFLEKNLCRLDAQEDGPTGAPGVQEISQFNISANQTIALACVAYLQLSEFSTVQVKTSEQWDRRLQKYAFYEYAADFWEHHANAGAVREHPRILELVHNNAAMAEMSPVLLLAESQSSEEESCEQCYQDVERSPGFDNLVASIRGWLQDCDTSLGHEICRKVALPNQQRPIRLLDTVRGCIVMVPRPKSQQYAALSYLWGGRQRVCLTSDNLPRLARPHGFCRIDLLLSRTIADAMEVCRSIGYRYLWVDALCIVQDDIEDMMYQIAGMDDVFKNAAITLVAAKGSHSDYGLIPLEFPDRPSPRTDACDPHEELRLLMAESPWDKRGWTLCEKILSRRLLIFAGLEQFLSCGKRLYRLDRSIESTPESAGRPRSLQYAECGHQLEKYLEIVKAFQARQFAIERDIPFAMSAIVRPLGSVMDGRPNFFISGMPTCAIDQLLSWRVEEHQPYARRTQFPSWSWYGWQQVPFFPEVLMNALQRNRDRPGLLITRCEYTISSTASIDDLGGNLFYAQGKTEPLRLETQVRRLEIEMCCNELAEGNRLFDVFELRSRRLLGKIQLSESWRARRGVEMDFIPILTTPDDGDNICITMLMCLDAWDSIDGQPVAPFFERVQIMDCNISEEYWSGMIGDVGNSILLY